MVSPHRGSSLCCLWLALLCLLAPLRPLSAQAPSGQDGPLQTTTDILPPGSANVEGIAGTGKIFTFSIRE